MPPTEKSDHRRQNMEASFSAGAKVGGSQGRGVALVLKMMILKCRAGGMVSSQGLSGKLKERLSGLLPSSSETGLLCMAGPCLRTVGSGEAVSGGSR